MKISKFVKEIALDSGDLALFNTYNSSILTFDKSYLHNNYSLNTERLTPLEHEYLLENNFFSSREEFILNELKKNYRPKASESKAMALIVELNYSCNLACSYCYQYDKGSRSDITDGTIEDIISYLKNVIDKNKVSRLKISLIGGEPFLHFEKIRRVFNGLSYLKSKFDLFVEVIINTNLTLINQQKLEILKSFSIDHVLLYTTLTLKEDHDIHRPNVNGSSSYDQIVQKLIITKSHLCASLNLEIRYNVNHLNINKFSEFLGLLNDIGLSKIRVEPMYTYNYDGNTQKNELSFRDFQIWNSTEAIHALIKNKFLVHYSLGSGFSACKAYREFNFKIFSDGKIGLCDASAYNKLSPTINDFVNNEESITHFETLVKVIDPFEDAECSKCPDLILCKGKFFCRERCQFSSLDINEFIKTYLDYLNKEESQYFVKIG